MAVYDHHLGRILLAALPIHSQIIIAIAILLEKKTNGSSHQKAKHTIMSCAKWDRAALFEEADSQDYREMVSTARESLGG